ncbi:hypothetical protein A0H81_14768 [Grifola frondosa]|uniref:Uncharacterized protein n=1 Tax=Grifola frondosa TaxID=5627 RepID=A0A1C7LKQ2_GRIFR|nr:hypothetical protein A0H81_14768 [Grifola frondosa]
MKLDGPVYSAAIAPSSPSLSSPVSDDDSPPSSPLLPPAGRPSTSPGLPHPFAASTKAVRGFSAYEKRENRRKKNFDTSRESVRETLSSNNYTAIRVQGSPSSSRVVDPYAASAKALHLQQ